MAHIEPTKEEKRNGWTAETLAEYIKERNEPKQEHPKLPTTQNRHSPFKR